MLRFDRASVVERLKAGRAAAQEGAAQGSRVVDGARESPRPDQAAD